MLQLLLNSRVKVVLRSFVVLFDELRDYVQMTYFIQTQGEVTFLILLLKQEYGNDPIC